MTALGYGSWPSPITSGLLVEDSVGLSDLDVADGDLVWSELRPSEQGRQCVVRWHDGDDPIDLLPAPFSARSAVHEYGGSAFVVAGDTCWFVNSADQRIWSVADGAEPVPLTGAVDPARSVRFGDLVIDRGRRALFAVRERHAVMGASGAEGVVNDLVRISIDGSTIDVLASGHDFYAAPRPSPDGRRLVFLAWDNPNMPWDESALYAIDLDASGEAALIAGDRGESISQPRFSPDGTLHYLSDRSGFTSLYREDGTAVIEIGADLGGPDWVFGQSSYAFTDESRVVVAVETARGSTLVHFDGEARNYIGVQFDVAS
ncbi:MAG TPA: hypothetical protein VG368_01415, partial [Acidimicrobiales bacterium]|nr:hypothetical protein [Acidimicrobiales bacterium]